MSNYKYIVIHACYNITEKKTEKEFVERMRPANLALFIYVSTHYVETVKQLNVYVIIYVFSSSYILREYSRYSLNH